jgi:hypothetical protein
MKYIRTATELLATAAKLDDVIDIRDSFSSYRRLVNRDGGLYCHNVELPLFTKRQLENDIELLFTVINNNNSYWCVENKEEHRIYIGDLKIDFHIRDCLEHYKDLLCFNYIFFIAPYSRHIQSQAYDLYRNFDLSFSEWCEGVEFISDNQYLDNPSVIWMLNVPKWLHKALDKQINEYTNLDDLFHLVTKLNYEFNLDNINKDDVLNVIELIYRNKISDLIDFIESISSLTIDYTLFSYLIPVIMDKSKKKVREVKYRKLNSRPYWCDEHIWTLFNDSKCYKGAEIVHQIAAELVQKYHPSKYFYVCMARDAVPLYNLLFSMNYDSMLGVFSRSQIGDDDSVELLKNEIAIASEMTGKLPLIVDVQGRGTIYDYLREQGLDCEMVFGVSSNPDNCRYPLLIDSSSIGNRAIKYIEKLPQSNGRAEGVYQVNRCEETYMDTLIAWGTRDPNAIGEELEDWEILQFRGLFMETMGVSHVHVGMIGNDHQQRMWGILQSRINVQLELGIKCKDQHIDLIRETRFKSQHEVGHSGGINNPEIRKRDEIKQFGNTGIRMICGIAKDDRDNGIQYGSNFCLINTNELLPYITVTTKDSLWKNPDQHYPATKLNELPELDDTYREVQYNTLLTWDNVLEVISC